MPIGKTSVHGCYGHDTLRIKNLGAAFSPHSASSTAEQVRRLNRSSPNRTWLLSDNCHAVIRASHIQTLHDVQPQINLQSKYTRRSLSGTYHPKRRSFSSIVRILLSLASPWSRLSCFELGHVPLCEFELLPPTACSTQR